MNTPKLRILAFICSILLCNNIFAEELNSSTETPSSKIVYEQFDLLGDYSNTYKLSLSNFHYDSNEVLKSFDIKLYNLHTGVEQIINYTPKYLLRVPDDGFSYFDPNANIIDSFQAVDIYYDVIFGDFNFDQKEDFAILNAEGSKEGPQYAYFIQDEQGKFILDDVLTKNVRFFPDNINNRNKMLTISHPIENSKQMLTTVLQKTNTSWDVLIYKIQDIN